MKVMKSEKPKLTENVNFDYKYISLFLRFFFIYTKFFIV